MKDEKRIYGHNLLSFQKLLVLLLLGIPAFSCQNEKATSNANSPTGMIFIPAGTFTMGGKSAQAYADEFPQHQVAVDAFYMDEHEVTNADFKKFVDATGYVTVAEKPIDWEELKQQLPPGTPKIADSLLLPGAMVFKATDEPVDLDQYLNWWQWQTGADWKHPLGPNSSIEDKMDHPVVNVAYEDAVAYCTWVGKRLPTEAEWEWAALGGNKQHKYPWGNEPIDQAYDKANFWQGIFPWKNSEKDGFYGTAPVKNFPANAYGLYDMAGNVWEWCTDRYAAQSYAADAQKGLVKNPKGPSAEFAFYFSPVESRVIRGGSFLCNDDYCSGYRVSRRTGADAKAGACHTGFRCVQDL